MSLIKKHLTNVAVNSFTDYMKEKFEEIKQLDLDHDGRKDIDQLKELLDSCGIQAKIAIESMDIQKLAQGLDQIMKGANMVASAIDGNALQSAGQELGKTLAKLGQLTQLGIEEAKKSGVVES